MWAAMLLLGALSIARAQLFEINYANSVTYYNYGIHRPTKGSSLPPVIVFLHGKGSVGPVSQAQQLLAYNGVGWMLSQYYQGNTSAANAIAAEQFLCILPLADTYTDSTGALQWRTDKILPVLLDASTKYAFDRTRIILVGYSMGARAAWPVLIGASAQWASLVGSNSSAWPSSPATPFAAAIAVGGQPSSSLYSSFGTIVGLPIQNYLGSNDYYAESGSSAVSATNYAMQQAAQRVGKNDTVQLVTVTSTHEDLQYGEAFNQAMMSWALAQSLAAPASATSSSSSSAASSTSSSTSSTRAPSTSTPAPSTTGSSSSMTPVQTSQRSGSDALRPAFALLLLTIVTILC